MQTENGMIEVNNLSVEEHEGECPREILEFSIRAWAPVFSSIKKTIGGELFEAFYKTDWAAYQKNAISSEFQDKNSKIWAAKLGDKYVGFIAVRVHVPDSLGEIYMVAVDPEYQNEGVGKSLTNHALNWMKSEGLNTAMVETGDDIGHAAARATYESVGFTAWPAIKYFKKLKK